MRVVLQRVSEASVSINGKTKAEIAQGFVLLLGIGTKDNEDDVEWLVNKIVSLRVFSDEQGMMNHSILDIGGEALVVSQFTLHASTKKGNRPSFIKAARPEQAIPLYELFRHRLSERMEHPCKTGEFGAMMDVNLTNHGPVTITIDTENKE